MKKEKIENVIIEASSHGLLQGRLDGINFKAGVFTNFSQDHLDYHKSMTNYFNSKMILFSKLLKKNSYVITDDQLKEFSKIKKIASSKKLKILTFNNDFLNEIPENIIGNFQKKNLSMAILASSICGLDTKMINSKIKKISNVNGRLQLVRSLPNGSKIFLDYAHTPDALRTVLESLKENFQNNISLVFGCGGERDKKKRPIMARVAGANCNRIYITDDNPRNENPKKIRQEIIKNLKNQNYTEIGNRKKAISVAIKNAKPNEIVLIAGKGHENTQNYGNRIIKISDKQIIKEIKVQNKKLSKEELTYLFNSSILNKLLKNKKIYKFNGVSINSKEVKRKNLFIAIKGLKKDGHNFVNEAFKNGASYCVVSKSFRKKSKKLIKVDNTFNFLKKFAFQKRSMATSQIIGVTGSTGKTTVKFILGNVLKIFGKTYFSPRSFNNHYGVPLSLSILNCSHKFGVFEIGMSKKGEIHKLSKIVRPKIGIITNISPAHLENFKNIFGIAKAKGEIINNLQKNGTLILNRDDKFFNFFRKKALIKNLKIISFGRSRKADIHPISINKVNDIFKIKIKILSKTINLKSVKININNILILLAVLKTLKLTTSKIENFFKYYVLPEGRGKIYKVKRFKKRFKFIDESYNANPQTVKNAIKNLSDIKTKNSKKYLLLGDMLELGVKSNQYHKNLSKVINNSDIDKFFVYGNKILNTYKYINENKRGNILQHLNDFDEIFSNVIKKDDYLMIKGSNATGLHNVSKNIIRGSKNAL